MAARISFTGFFAQPLVSSWDSGRNCVANARRIACVTSVFFSSSPVFGVTFSMKRLAASATRPSQWPDARAWFTMRANAAASGVGTHGSLPPAQTSGVAPNMATRSVASNSSVVRLAEKLANENPCSAGASVDTAGVRARSAPPDDPPLHPESVMAAASAAARTDARQFLIPLPPCSSPAGVPSSLPHLRPRRGGPAVLRQPAPRGTRLRRRCRRRRPGASPSLPPGSWR